MFQKAHAREWNKFEVQGWIESLGVKGPDSEKLPDLFLKHCVDGDMLFSDIDDETLKELGVGFLQRKKIMRELLQLVCAVEEREHWDKGSELEVWSNKYGQWVSGEILDVFTDEEGEWLEIGYKNFSKQVQRFCEDIRPLEKRVQERIQMKKNDLNNHLVTTTGGAGPGDTHHSNPYIPSSRQNSHLTEKELHTFLPDPEARKIWLGCLPQPSRTVNIHILLQQLAQEFGRITSTQYRGLQLSDINYLTTLLRSRFDVKNNKVTIQIFAGFWSTWYYPLCQTVKDIREIWDHNPTLVHGLVTKNTCEHKLKDSTPGTFLIRFSDSQGGCLSIVFFDGTRVRYLLVQPLRNKKHQFKICVGRAVKKSTFHQLILSLKRLTYLYNLQDDSTTDKSIFSQFEEKNEEFPEVYEAPQYGGLNNRHKPVADPSPASVPQAIFISGREGLDGKYIQQKDWRGGRPVYLGPVHPQENEQISLWFDDERSEWTLSLASFMGSAHCLAYVTHGASDPTQIPPQAVWSIASGVQSGWFEERLLIRSVTL